MQTLKPCPFCGSEARMWPSHTKADSNGSYEIIGCSNVECHIEPTTAEYLPYEEAVKRWNTRPGAPVDGLVQSVIDFLEADEDNIYHLDPKELDTLRKFLKPAAPVDGLETVAWRFRHSEQEKWHYDAGPQNWWEKQELVTRSQAVAIIAAERQQKEVALADRKMLLDLASSNGEKVSTLEADNAALAARVKELGAENVALKSDVAGSASIIEHLKQRADANFDKVIEEGKRAKALETQLAAANKDLERFREERPYVVGVNDGFTLANGGDLEAKP